MIDWKHINNYIDNAKSILLTMHENPDGDGLGSATAMYYYLKEIKKDCRILNVSSLPVEYNFLNKDNIIETYKSDIHDSWISSVDLAIIFDVGDYKRIRDLKTRIKENNIKTLNIDHHPHPKDHPFTYNIVDLKAASTGDMVYDYIKSVRNGKISKLMAEGIYTAVMTDTGCFRYSNTNTHCHDIAIECIEVGVNTTNIYQLIYESSSQSRILLLGNILRNIHYELDGEFAWFVVDKNMMSSAKASKADVEGFSDFVRTIRGVEVSMMIMQIDEASCRLNFRSTGKYIINGVAVELGGGGHKFASGAVMHDSLESVVNNSVEIMKKSLLQQRSELT
ncbi:MAG: DHH family phosphoesterase [Candidatus Neomarinimicrobiota bacterium]